MGQGPSLSHENSSIEYAAGSSKGSNSKVENVHCTILDLDGSSSTSFFGVYDGHGGADVALYCANNFHRVLVNDGDYKDNLDVALKRAFTRMDEQLDQNDDWRTLANPPGVGVKLLCFPSTAPRVQGTPYMEGSTACVVLIRGNQIILGNVGDSCCVLSRDDSRQATELSTNHTPENQDERNRIKTAGGQLLNVGGADLVNGILPLTRAIGTFRFKPPSAGHIVTCIPDMHIADITHDTKYLLIANRAFWDTTPISSEMAVKYLRQYSGSYSVASMCDKLLNLCRNPVDNLTLILVYFKPSARLPRPVPPAPTNLPVPVVG
ncbi:putative protein phosphatase 2C 21 [Triticum urartu]|uniref:protein-serine/threonine phosphatase n=1 Tax=Triticum urartu TaxID=4572 RepID=M7YI63_TRIUA|nr:probable protein phosphatase 2C 21 [Triticum urartu]XP_048536514.1 probable protein phosphatase 2C 21 [Triticum urartu]XP_048536526.1 probable protein phosphatase 2C 21 [Triticum urartu]XP_048536527.1 probable protein phosphatase 2C 21 [Triticum urartu]XP_048536533.1 probable protein phosphatase 2C 21 [Triticum urartu]XP_048536534.1 probable protein phosphatase 2C 21 [Triticum urartu]EMS46481.1 putative protein phosphatase 2C 21 [Triticum urartu]